MVSSYFVNVKLSVFMVEVVFCFEVLIICSCFPIFDELMIRISLFGKALHLSSIIFSFCTLKNVGKVVIL